MPAFDVTLPDSCGNITAAGITQNWYILDQINKCFDDVVNLTIEKRYKQIFSNINAGNQQTITENGGVLPTDMKKIDVWWQGQKIYNDSGDTRWRISGSDIIFEEYLDGNYIGPKQLGNPFNIGIVEIHFYIDEALGATLNCFSEAIADITTDCGCK